MTKTHVPIRDVQYLSHDHIIIVSSQKVSNVRSTSHLTIDSAARLDCTMSQV